MLDDEETTRDPATLRGIAAGPGTYTGTARVIRRLDDLARLQFGDVLVSTATGESLASVAPLLGALVTDSGGLLSHAAIIGRKHGIPTVVGTRDATALIADGTLVRVHGDTGEVEVLG